MFETPIAVVGNIVNDPIRRGVGDQEVMKFRVASNSRRRGADGTWEPGNSLFVTVNCWGRLVTGVGASLRKGSPVVVVGHVYTSEYEDREGIRRSTMELRASCVGPDLSRCIARVQKMVAAGPDGVPAGPAEPVASTEDGDTGEADHAVSDDSETGLSLTA
ncbi:single-stranded DNA-binding protein [Mycobacterium sp. pUA109]|uniref:single-stranded DNA-binding protein n=1 Tax=Mycobacterium sp. pUA109 TaxID=3238982 RepID=UPI00351B18B5